MIRLSPINIGRIILRNQNLSTDEIYDILCDKLQIPEKDKLNDMFLTINLKVEIRMMIDKCTRCDGKLPCRSPFLFWVEYNESNGYHFMHCFCKVKEVTLPKKVLRKLQAQRANLLKQIQN